MTFSSLAFICRALRAKGYSKEERREWLQWRLNLHREATNGSRS